jgi:hypothetical protein
MNRDLSRLLVVSDQRVLKLLGRGFGVIGERRERQIEGSMRGAARLRC